MVLSHWILLDARWEGPRSERRTLEAQRNGDPCVSSITEPRTVPANPRHETAGDCESPGREAAHGA